MFQKFAGVSFFFFSFSPFPPFFPFLYIFVTVIVSAQQEVRPIGIGVYATIIHHFLSNDSFP